MARRKKKNVIVLPFWAFVTIIIIGGICFGIWYFLIYSKNANEESTTTTEEGTKEVINSDDGYNENIIYDNFQIHFLELGNDYAGDSVYIKANNYDILIDAGSRGNSAEYINKYVKNYCNDGKLEYVIATQRRIECIS